MSFLPKPLKITAMFVLFGTILFTAYLITTFAIILNSVGSPDLLHPVVKEAWNISCIVAPVVAAYLLARRYH